MRKVLVGSTIAMMLLTSVLANEKKVPENKANTKKELNNTKQETEVKKEPEVKEPVQEVVVEQLDGKKLFKICSDCHGEKAEKEALGKSQVIAGWDKERIINSINGYKNGNYGGLMKNIMRGHVADKNDAEIEALANYISTINNSK